MSKKITSIKHKGDKRAHIPSKEEAGMETGSEQVKKKDFAEYPVNPVVHRGQDPELFWRNKYGNDDREDLLKIDIRSLYRHEHISPELLINNLYKIKGAEHSQLDMFSLFGNTIKMDELEKVADYYKYSDNWKNRLIQGDSLLVMTSLLEREGMAGKVQTIYFDPPYGIKYAGNWQININDTKMPSSDPDEALTGEPEQVKAFRDTWIDGIHSYLSYLRDRLIIAKELLTDTGSCFLQISDENLHLAKSVMDEVFGSENFVSVIPFVTTSSQTSVLLPTVCDFIIWYGKSKENIKYRQLYTEKELGGEGSSKYTKVKLPNGESMSLKDVLKNNNGELPKGAKVYRLDTLTSQSGGVNSNFEVDFNGLKIRPRSGYWKTGEIGMKRLIQKGRVEIEGRSLAYVRYIDDFPAFPIGNVWTDFASIQSRSDPKVYVVQTANKTIQRCLLMTTDPGDLVLDPTCGSGTAAYVAEQWGRRWITIDTSRIALNIAKTRLMTAVFPYYELYDQIGKDVRQGFVYKTVSHITLRSLATDEPSEQETLYDQPKEDKKKLRVAGPFTVETLQNFEPLSPGAIDNDSENNETIEQFEQRIFEHLKSAGIRNGKTDEKAVFKRVERLVSPFLNAEGFYDTIKGESKAYFHIGPRFGTISRESVNSAVKECRQKGDADWLVILGFSFESDIEGEKIISTSLGSFRVDKVRIHDDLMQEGLLKNDKKAASFVTIGEPDIQLIKKESSVAIEIQGMDIYDPIKDEVKARSVADIAYWMVDDDYDSSNFIVKQVFFCGGDKDEFDKWKKGLSTVSKDNTKAKAQNTLRIEIADDAFDRLYGFQSHPIEYKKGKKIAVRVISQFGEESMKVITL
jgi:adenine-specific DNA-methyltransferase